MSEQSRLLPLLAAGALALGLDLDSEQIRRFSLLYEELIAWNQRVNLTTVTAPDDVQVKHFLDSLTAAAVLGEELSGGTSRLVDVGSGAGLPGLALAIALPRLQVALLEATAKKARFLEHVVGVLDSGNVGVLHGRAEEMAHDPTHREAYDVGTARAVGKVGTLVELVTPFLRVGGLAILMKTRAALGSELAEARGALERLRSDVEGVRDVGMPGIEDHVLILVRKRGSTPSEYPRRVGLPGRRPLTGKSL